MKFYVVLLFIVEITSFNLKNNVCNTFLDYYIKPFSKKCWYNPDVETDMPKLVTQHGYSLQTYNVTTKDGYVLTVYRMPQKKVRRGVVFLQHPATASCTTFVDKGNISMAYFLHKEGYEVWLGNARGSYYSKKHVSLKTSSKKYWNFTYHEMGTLDIPAQIDLAIQISQAEKLTYIGHSMSGTSGTIYASLLPEHAKKYVNLFILMAPVIYLKKITTAFKYIAPYGNAIYHTATAFHSYEFGKRTEFGRLCYQHPFMVKLCAAFATWFGGFARTSFHQISPDIVPIMYSQTPAGLSLKCVNHFSQNVQSGGHFQYYDYGTRDNLKYYGSKTPPNYPLHKINVPVKVIAGRHDSMVSIEGLKDFLAVLPKEARKYDLEIIEEFNHINFVYAKDLDILLNPKIKKTLLDVY